LIRAQGDQLLLSWEVLEAEYLYLVTLGVDALQVSFVRIENDESNLAMHLGLSNFFVHDCQYLIGVLQPKNVGAGVWQRNFDYPLRMSDMIKFE